MAEKEYIEREKILDCLAKDYCKRTDNEEALICNVWDKIKKIPTADVVEVRHGKWKEIQGEVGNPFNNQVFDTVDLLVCSVCNEIFDVSEARNYCPNCGAKMDGKGEGDV